MNKWDLNKYLIFAVSFIVFIVLLISIIYIICKKHKKASKFFIGLITSQNIRTIISTTLIIMNFFYIAFCLIMKMNFDIYIIIISSVLIFISFLLTYNIKYIISNLFINGVNISLLYLSTLVSVLRSSSDEVIFYILQILMNFFALLFYMFTSLKFLKNINKKRS